MTDILMQFLGVSAGVAVIIVLCIYFFMVLFPTLVIADAIKKAARISVMPAYIKVEAEMDDYFILENNIFVSKNCYIDSEKYYKNALGIFIPVYDVYFSQKKIIGFNYKK